MEEDRHQTIEYARSSTPTPEPSLEDLSKITQQFEQFDYSQDSQSVRRETYETVSQSVSIHLKVLGSLVSQSDYVVKHSQSGSTPSALTA